MLDRHITPPKGIALAADLQLLVQETNHRVANALQLTASMVRLEAGGIADPAVHGVLMAVQSRIAAIAMVHRLLCGSPAADAVRLDEYLPDLIGELASWCETDALTCRIAGSIAPVTVSPERASMIGILVTELVTNACKHAFPDARAGIIAVRLDACDRELVLQLSDDGVGQRSCARSAGIGQRLIEAILCRLGGTLHRVPVPRGTCLLIRLPRIERQN